MIDTVVLRKKVIDLAIQGKLTQQLPEDGNAEDLYVQIQEEKAKLVKEGKIKKEINIPGIADDEIPFDIPDNWIWVRLRDVCRKIVDGDHNPPAGTKEKTEYLMLSAQNINNDELVNIENARYLTESVFYEENKRTQLEEGDVLLTIVATLGRSCVYRGQLNACFQRSVCVITTMIIPEYLKRVFDSGYIQKTIEDNATGAAQPGFYLNKVEKLCIPLPPVSEQKRIVDRLDDVVSQLNNIDSLQKQYESDREILKGKIIDAGIQGKLTEQLPEDGNVDCVLDNIRLEKETILVQRKGRQDKNIKKIGEDLPFEAPKHWRWGRLGDMGLFKKGPFGSALTKAMFVPKGEDTIKVYEQQHAIQKNKDLGKYYITREYFETKMTGFEVCSGDIIVSCAGTIGESYIMPNNIEQGIINQALMRITLSPSVNKRFFQYYFDSNLKKNAQDESNGSAIKNIPPFEVMKNWYFPVTSVEEQGRIVDKIDEILQALGIYGGGSDED